MLRIAFILIVVLSSTFASGAVQYPNVPYNGKFTGWQQLGETGANQVDIKLSSDLVLAISPSEFKVWEILGKDHHLGKMVYDAKNTGYAFYIACSLETGYLFSARKLRTKQELKDIVGGGMPPDPDAILFWDFASKRLRKISGVYNITRDLLRGQGNTFVRVVENPESVHQLLLETWTTDGRIVKWSYFSPEVKIVDFIGVDREGGVYCSGAGPAPVPAVEANQEERRRLYYVSPDGSGVKLCNAPKEGLHLIPLMSPGFGPVLIDDGDTVVCHVFDWSTGEAKFNYYKRGVLIKSVQSFMNERNAERLTPLAISGDGKGALVQGGDDKGEGGVIQYFDIASGKGLDIVKLPSLEHVFDFSVDALIPVSFFHAKASGLGSDYIQGVIGIPRNTGQK